MANKKYSRKTSEEKLEEIKELSKIAFKQIEKYTTSPKDVLEYAEFMSRFYKYSLNNQSLIHSQFSNAVGIASFKDWKDKGYFINKGEKGIQILSFTPVTLFIDKEGKEKSLKYATKEEKELIKNNKIKTKKVKSFSIGHVFDISQTNAPVEDLPNIFPNRQHNFKIEEGTNKEYLKQGIIAVSENLNIQIKDMKESTFNINELGSSKGAFVQGINSDKKEIILNSRNTETQSIATSIHELAHARLHGFKENNSFDKATKEFQAELTSYIVCKHYGIDTSEKAIPYIANWTKNGEKIEDKQLAFEGVHTASKEFMNIIDDTISKEIDKDNLSKKLDYAKELIADFLNNEYGENETDFIETDLEHIGIAYTTTEDEDHEIQAEIDLKNYKINQYIDGELVISVQYDNLDAFINSELERLEFDNLVYIEEKDFKQFLNEQEEKNLQDQKLVKRVSLKDLFEKFPTGQNISDKNEFDKPDIEHSK